jgi:agmatine deiminase
MEKQISFENFRFPAEWELHQSVWLAWPSDADLWQESLKQARSEFVQLCFAIAGRDSATGQFQGERLEVLVPNSSAKREAEQALEGIPARFHEIPFGDIWLRDTGPLFLKNSSGKLSTIRFRFNGWGEKYILPFDDQVAQRISQTSGLSEVSSQEWILEGGSIEVDGEGTCLTTRQCLLNPNRNPGLTQGQIEQRLKILGVQKVLWLNEGLLNDHTDGHIDTLVRFVAPAKVVCMESYDPQDPNREILNRIIQDLSTMKDAKGRLLEVVRIPAPGRVLDETGRVMPASYVNFYIGNRTVVVPIYGTAYDAEAVSRIGECFPNRQTIGVSARAILSGGGAFHCISQQQPA